MKIWVRNFTGGPKIFPERIGPLAEGEPFPEMVGGGALLQHMGVAGFSALIVAAAVAVTTRVQDIENGIIHA